jgi:hypothetical protein
MKKISFGCKDDAVTWGLNLHRMSTPIFDSSKADFKAKTGMDAIEYPAIYIEFVKMKAQERMVQALDNINTRLTEIKNEMN